MFLKKLRLRVCQNLKKIVRLTFDFDLILGSFLTFWGPNGLFCNWGRVQKLF